ncbi:baculovirus J domain protein [Apocheima cinerarium nucleopolyhedrovirus]|uniref:baculovirus J domain protein n=1 Tax=Apocheima cinerarium nucleopolyhedrovirus TaxID=307461 RepID=UPI0001D9204B|nr:baculovirus J domain protein [Apocheima cinerarium nucleopolyhedrovirus]ADB84383.1 baculovirus J domain protein [Apocheima cinerarium nucleopolyhedrovirus]
MNRNIRFDDATKTLSLRKRPIVAVTPQLNKRNTRSTQRKTNIVNEEDTFKVQKTNTLYYKNIHTLDLYSFFGINKNLTAREFIHALNKSYNQILKNYNETSRPDDLSSSFNSYLDIVETAKSGYEILKDYQKRKNYNQSLSLNKRSQILSLNDRFEKNYHTLVAKLNSARNKFNSLDKNELHTKVKEYFDSLIEKNIPLRNSAYNRVLVRWQVAIDNYNNENVTLDTLRNYFERYGRIKGIIFCVNKKGCALIEFATSDAAEAAISDNTNFNNSMYVTQDAHKWTIDLDTKNKLKNIYNQIESIQQKQDNNEIVKLQI